MYIVSKITINEDRCKGCGLCIKACPKKIIEISKSKINKKGYHPASVINNAKCIGCMSCAIMCPDVAITIER